MQYGPDKWNERYSTKEYVYGKEPNQFLIQNYEKIPKGTVLCVADGEGRNSVFLAKQGYAVTAIDFSQQAIEKTEQLADENGVTVNTVCADLLDHDFGENKFSGIISIYSHFSSQDIIHLHAKYYAALQTGGVFLIEAFAKEQLPLDSGGPKNIDLLYSIEDIDKSFPVGEIQLLKKDVVYLHEGDLHDGKAVVVRTIIRKS